MALKVEGDKLTGHLNEIKLEGTIKGNELIFTGKRPSGDLFGDFKGKSDSSELTGTGLWRGNREITWSAKRPATPPSSPRVHDFEPKEFHRVFSDAIPPALRIFPGDTDLARGRRRRG
jgi:hypothetical protein